MAVTFADVGAQSSSAAATTLTPVIQTHSVGDFLIAVFLCRLSGAGISTPSGWTAFGGIGTTTLTVGAFYRIATGSDSNPVATFTSCVCSAQIVRFQGTNATGLGVVGTNTVGSVVTHTSTSITSTAANSLAVAFDAMDNAGPLSVVPTGWTLATDPTGAQALSFGMFTKQLAGSGSTTGATSTSQTIARWQMFQFELLVATAVDVLISGGCL
jgi:hypothetical protein